MFYEANRSKKLDFKKINIKIPLIIFLSLIMLEALIGIISFKMLLNLSAFQIITAGILISVFISYPIDVLKNTVETIRKSYKNGIDYESTINKVHNLAIEVKKNGLLSIQYEIEYEDNIFIRDAMILLNDYKDYETIEDIMDHDIESRYVELYKPYKVMEMIANIAPAFGLVGTLVGLIGLLSDIANPGEIMGNMASALVSTLYGSLIANLIAFPLMARIQEYNEQKLLEYRMIKEGILLIASDDTTRNVFDKMNVMLNEENRVIYQRRVIYTDERGQENHGMEEFL